ncbi:MAG: glycosyltransferase [Planctomycetota bacterium]
MRILQVVHGWFPRNRGGTERYVASLARGLFEDGHEVAILAGSERDSDRGALEREVWEGMPLYRLRRSGLYLESWYHSYHPDSEVLFAELLDGLKPDVVHIHHWHRLTRNLVELCAAAGIPSVVTLHDTSSTCPKSLRLRDGGFCERSVSPESCGDCAQRFFFQSDAEMDQGLISFQEDFAQELRLTNCLIAPSKSLAAVVAGQYPGVKKDIRVLVHGALPESLPTKVSPARPRAAKNAKLRLAYWGELAVAKGLALLLDALENVGRDVALEVDLWGDFAAAEKQQSESWRTRTARMAKRGGVQVNWRGPFEPSSLGDDYDLAVFPSIVCESHSFTVDEAFARGIPILVPNRGGPSDRLRGAGATFLSEDAKDLSRVIKGILKSPELLDRWRQAVVQPKSMDANRKEIFAFYRDAIAEGARGDLIDPRLARARSQFQLRRQSARDLELYEQRGQDGETQHKIVELKQELVQRDETIVHKDGVLDDFNRELKRLSEALDHRDREANRMLSDRQDRVREVEDLLADRDAAIAGRDRELQSFANSVKDLEQTLDERRRSSEETRVEHAAAMQAQESRASMNEAELSRQLQELADRKQMLSDLRSQLGDRDQKLQQWSVLAQSREAEVQNKDAEISAATAIVEKLDQVVAAARAEANTQQEAKAVLAGRIEKLERVRDNLESSLEDRSSRLSHLQAQLEQLSRESEDVRAEIHRLDNTVSERLGPIVEEFIGRTPDHVHEKAEQHLEWAVGNHARLHELLAERDALIDALAREIESVEERDRKSKSTSRSLGRRERLGQRLGAWRRKLKPRPADGKTRLLVVVHDFLPRHAAGTEIYTFKLLQELKSDHDVHLLFCESRPELPRYTVSEGMYEGLPYTEVVHNYHWESFEETYHNPEMEEIFERVLDQFDPDIVHIQHLQYFSFNFIPIAKNRGLPVVYTLHEFMFLCARGGQLLREDYEICELPVPEKCADCIRHQPLAEDYGTENRRRRLEIAEGKLPQGLREAFSRFTGPLASADLDEDGRKTYAEAARRRLEFISERAKLVDLFISPSAFLRQKFIDSGMINPEKIIHSDNGFDLTPFDGVERVESDILRFGFVGTIADYKGVHLMIEAFEEIPDDDVELQIWGDIEIFKEYKQRLLATTRGDNVHLKGRFENGRIAEVLAGIDVLIVPSIWFENSPLTIHEAWMAGIPVIASNRGGMAELVDHEVNGLHFKLGDAADLARQCRRLIDNPELIEEFKQNLGEVKAIAANAIEIGGYYRALLQGGVVTK